MLLEVTFLSYFLSKQLTAKNKSDIIYAYYIKAFHNSLNQIIWTIQTGWQEIITSDNVRLWTKIW